MSCRSRRPNAALYLKARIFLLELHKPRVSSLLESVADVGGLPGRQAVVLHSGEGVDDVGAQRSVQHLGLEPAGAGPLDGPGGVVAQDLGCVAWREE